MKIVLHTLLLTVLFLATTAWAEKQPDLNVSEELTFFTEEGDLDMSNYLSQAYGFLPVPILITEPAIGYGGGAAIVYLHDKFVGRKGASGPEYSSEYVWYYFSSDRKWYKRSQVAFTWGIT